MENQTNRDDHRLLFKEEVFSLAVILGLMKQAPKIDVKVEEINRIVILTEEHERFKVQCMPDEYGDHEVAFYKQEGKMTVLLGARKAQRQIEQGLMHITGRLISHPGLKKANYEDYVKRRVVAAPPQPVYSTHTERRPSPTPYRGERPRTFSTSREPTPYNGTTARRDFNKS
jgi:hypothetical protein